MTALRLLSTPIDWGQEVLCTFHETDFSVCNANKYYPQVRTSTTYATEEF